MRRRPFGIRPIWGLMRCRLFGVRLIRLICRLRQWWLSGALRVGQCSCVGWRWFGGFVCVRGQLVDHGIAPERWVQRRGYHRIHCRRNFSHRLCNLPTEMMRPTEIARWSQLTIRSSSPATREGKDELFTSGACSRPSSFETCPISCRRRLAVTFHRRGFRAYSLGSAVCSF